MARRRWMLFLDICLFILIVLLFSPLITALSLHELLGVIFILPFIFHLLFSWLWINHTTRRFFKSNSWRHKLNYLLNLILFVSIIVEILSGLILSQVLLPAIGIKTVNDWKWRALHNQTSTIILIIASFHIAMNWQRIVSYFRKKVSVANNVTKNNVHAIFIIVRGLRRGLFIVSVTVIIIIISFYVVGTPDKESVNLVNDTVRFKQNVVAGSVQVVGTIITIAILAYIAHRWLKIRL